MPSKTLLTLTLLLTPALVSAAFVPLVGIPGIDAEASFNDYINALYALSISIAALIAVIKIIIAGVKWMLSDVASSKQEAKSDIEGALLGLLLIIAAVLILEVINPQLKSSSLFLGKVDTVTRAPAVGGGGGGGSQPGNWPFDSAACPNNNNNTSGCQMERAKCAAADGKVKDVQGKTICSFDEMVEDDRYETLPMDPGGTGGGTGMLAGGKFTDSNVFPDGTEVPWHFTEINDKIAVINKAFSTRAPNLNDDAEWYFVWRILNNVPFSKGTTGSSNKSYATRIMGESDCKTCFKHPEDYIGQINKDRQGGSVGGGTGDLGGGGTGGGSSPVVNNDYGNPAISAVSSEPVTSNGVTMTTMSPLEVKRDFAKLQALVKPGTLSIWAQYGTSENNLNKQSDFIYSYQVGTAAAMVQEADTSLKVRLTPDTVYYYKICSTKDGKTTTGCGNVMKFKTLP